MGDYNASFWGPEQNKIEILRKQSTPNVARLEQVHESRKIGFFLSHRVPTICLTSSNMTFQKFRDDSDAQWTIDPQK